MSSYELWNLQDGAMETAPILRKVAVFSMATQQFTFEDLPIIWMNGQPGRIVPFRRSDWNCFGRGTGCHVEAATDRPGVVECSPGYFYSNHTQQCMPCRTGTYCPDGKTAVNCPRGYFSEARSGALFDSKKWAPFFSVSPEIISHATWELASCLIKNPFFGP